MERDLSHIPVLVPEGVEDAGDLPMGVLDAASHHLGCDFIDAVKGLVPGKRYAAYAELCYQWARRAGVEKPKRDTYREWDIGEVSHALGWDREEAAPDPTGPNDGSSSDSSESP